MDVTVFKISLSACLPLVSLSVSPANAMHLMYTFKSFSTTCVMKVFVGEMIYTVFRKKHPFTFSFISP